MIKCSMTQLIECKEKFDHKALRQHWRGVMTFPNCTFCLFEDACLSLRCSHGLCERCCWQLSRRSGTLCRLEQCPACGICVSFVVRLRPPTAGYRVLSLDGGGVRGIVLLDLLSHVSALSDLGLQPFHLFDVIVGTSTGAIVASTLGIKKWSTSRCVEEFVRVAKATFAPASRLSSFWGFLRSLFTDDRYDSRTFTEALKKVFGPSAKLRGPELTSTHPEYVKVVLTVTTLKGEPEVLANYPRAVVRKQDHHGELNREARIWEASV
jgi:hypothetical protein